MTFTAVLVEYLLSCIMLRSTLRFITHSVDCAFTDVFVLTSSMTGWTSYHNQRGVRDDFQERRNAAGVESRHKRSQEHKGTCQILLISQPAEFLSNISPCCLQGFCKNKKFILLCTVWRQSLALCEHIYVSKDKTSFICQLLWILAVLWWPHVADAPSHQPGGGWHDQSERNAAAYLMVARKRHLPVVLRQHRVGRFQVQPGRIRPVSLTRRYHSTTLLIFLTMDAQMVDFYCFKVKKF